MNYNCVLLYGDDSYSLKKNLELLFKTNEINEEDIEIYDYEEDGMEKAITNAMTLPFLSKKKGVILRDCIFLSDKKVATTYDIEILTKYCGYNNPTTLFVMLAPYEKLDLRKNIAKYLTKNIDTKRFYINRNSNSIYDNIKEEVAKNGLTIDPLALTQFVNRIGNNSNMLENELNKLITYSMNEKIITSDMVYAVVTRNIDDNIFDLVNAVVAHNINQIMDIYSDLKSIKIDPIWILTMISKKFQEILYTKELIKQKYNSEEIMKYFKASRGRTYYIMQNAKNISDEELMEVLTKIEKLDFKIKSGKIDKILGIELFLMSLN